MKQAKKYLRCSKSKKLFEAQGLHSLYEQRLQRVPVLNYSYSVKTGKPFVYFKNPEPIIIN